MDHQETIRKRFSELILKLLFFLSSFSKYFGGVIISNRYIVVQKSIFANFVLVRRRNGDQYSDILVRITQGKVRKLIVFVNVNLFYQYMILYIKLYC